MRIRDGFLSLLRRIRRLFSGTPDLTASAHLPKITHLGRSRGGIHGSFFGIFRKPAYSSAREEVFPGLFVRELEQRRVLSASSLTLQEVGRTLVIGAGLQAGNGSPETFEVARQGNNAAGLA